MPRLSLAPLAREDIKDIGRYTLKTWGAAQRDRYLTALAAALENLTIDSSFGQPRYDLRQGLLVQPFRHHLIFFRRESSGDVAVLRILHERMDIDRRF